MRETIDQQLAAHPAGDTFDRTALADGIDACLTCVAVCGLCADACIGEGGMDECVRRCSDCATVCAATAAVLTRPTPHGEAWRTQLEACIAHCEACIEECGGHDHDHCRNCTDACRRCVEALRHLLTVAD